MNRSVSGAIVAACAVLLSGCAHSPESIAANDPFEPMNRAVYKFDQRVDRSVVVPLAGIYFYYLPPPVHHGIHNVFTNLDLPVTFANDVLQLRPVAAVSALSRFVLNSSLGLGGLVDLATPAGIPYKPSDFGETLGRYGVPEGPFLVLPIIGPDPPRDLAGDAVDVAMHPLFWLPPGAPFYEHALVSTAIHAGAPFEAHATHIVLRQELEKGSVDPYVTMRSIYRQLRDEDINGGVPDSKSNPPMPK
jgi:phospholipid-binding lipoprotein MlaA